MKNIEKYIKIYRDGLLKNTMPFWVNHGIDYNYGGFKMALDRNGRVLDTDKGMWQTSRFTWMLATLYNEVEKNSYNNERDFRLSQIENFKSGLSRYLK